VGAVPSLIHEGLVLLFRNRPELAPELLPLLGVKVPRYTEIRIESADLTEPVPAEYRADLVVLLVDGRPVLAIVVEVQLAPDPRKLFTWPLYATGVRARFECQALVLVVAPEASVARWAARPIDIGPGHRFVPLVVGPDAVPVVTSVEEAAADPELAVLSVLAHGNGDVEQAVRIALVATEAAKPLEEDVSLLYFRLVRAALSEAARKAFQMIPDIQRFFDEDQRRSYEKGRAEGEAKGRAEGEAKGRAEAILAVLSARGVTLTDEQRQRVYGCTDIAVLDQWLRRAATVASTAELFA
jgi:hypothetical protein